MASRKALKKNVNYIAGELFAECLMNSLYVPGIRSPVDTMRFRKLFLSEIL